MKQYNDETERASDAVVVLTSYHFQYQNRTEYFLFRKNFTDHRVLSYICLENT